MGYDRILLFEDADGDGRFERREETAERWFSLLERYAVALLCLGALWCALRIVHLAHFSDIVVGFLVRVITIVSVAKLLSLSCRTLSHTLSTWGDKQLGQGPFRHYWERVTRLFPFGERCFEAAVYVSAASMCIRELDFIAVIADYGSRIVECIGIFFGTRVLIELLTVLLNEAFGMNDEERPVDQKGQTLVPLLQSVGQYVLYFGSGVMILGVLGVPTSPILAGAGILGLAGGLGAQSLVTDVVSGFFILFENQYLVGDYVKINDAAGRIEAVSIRHTQVRDDQGRLHIIPNGQIKAVVNYSKGFVIAEVDIKVPADRNVNEIFQAMTEAGRRLRKIHREVLGDTVIKGLVDLSPSDMTIRAVTRVQPGTHQAMQAEYRRMLKEVFDEQKTATLKLAA
jgi:small conductance mechanosensitive channel